MTVLLLACAEGDPQTLLAHALREGYGLSAMPPIERGPWGKPFFPDALQIHFSLSHSGPYAFSAVGGEAVGVDIEVVKPRSPHLPRMVLTDKEYAWYEENGGDWQAFYTLWTRKESFCKREGRGIVRSRRVCPPLPGESLELRSFSGLGWVGAVCSDEPIPAIQWLKLERPWHAHVGRITARLPADSGQTRLRLL